MLMSYQFIRYDWHNWIVLPSLVFQVKVPFKTVSEYFREQKLFIEDVFHYFMKINCFYYLTVSENDFIILESKNYL